MVTHINAINEQKVNLLQIYLKKTKTNGHKAKCHLKSIYSTLNDKHSVNVTIYANMLYLQLLPFFLSKGLQRNIYTFQFDLGSQEFFYMPLDSLFLLMQWLHKTLDSLIKSQPHSAQEHSINDLIPNLRQEIQGRISSTLLPQCKIIDICFMSITVSLLLGTIQINYCPK